MDNHIEKAREIEQAQMWFHYLQIPRKATYSDVMTFKKILEESKLRASTIEECARVAENFFNDWPDDETYPSGNIEEVIAQKLRELK